VLIHLENDAARLLHLSPRTLQRYRKDGCGPKFVRRGRRGLGYTHEAIADWIAEHTHTSIAGEYAVAEKRDNHGDAGLHQSG
jgi:predicted DNA-binding transcriptional regulator AlpA